MTPPKPEDFETEEGIDWIAYYDAIEDYQLESEQNWVYE